MVLNRGYKQYQIPRRKKHMNENINSVFVKHSDNLITYCIKRQN